MRLINIYNNHRKIFLFCRDNEGKQIIEEDNTFFPYFYEVDTEGKFKSYDGKSLKKIFVSEPSDVPKRRSDQAYEGDILFTKRYMIDKINKLTKCPIKYTFIDIEVLCDELPNVEYAKHTISCISAYNSLYKNIQTWYLKDYKDELEMLKEFVGYMKKESFDLWLSWNVKFDYNYLFNRIEGMRYDFNKKSLAELISPIGKSRYGDGEIFYPAGTSIVDYLTWFKKITLNRRKSYALDSIAQVDLGEQANEKIEFGKLTPKIKEKNIHDIERMVKLEEKFKLIDYYDEIRRLSKVEWEDMIWSSRIIDMLLLEEAKNQNIVLPMKPAEERGTLTEKEEYEGAYRDIFKTGAFIKSVGKYDLSSAYPSMIVDFCLDPTNICDVPLNTPIIEGDVRIEKTVFRQNFNTILPTVVKKLITLKTEIKSKLLTSKEMKTKYDAIKSIVNSSYGVFGNRFFRLYDKRIASATTYLVRDVLHYVQDKLEEEGYKIIYVDTDGILIDNNIDDISSKLNNLVKQWAKEKYNKDQLTTEFNYEGYYEKLLLLAKCRYYGELRTNKGELKEETCGIEAKRKDSTVYMKKFQKELINRILNRQIKENIISWIKEQIKQLPNQELKDIAFPCKLARDPEKYKNVPIFLRALNNTPNFKKKVGDNFYYIFVKPDGEQSIKTLIKIKPTRDISYAPIELDENLSRKEGIEYARKSFKLPELESSKISVLHRKEKAKDVQAFDENNYEHLKRSVVDWDMIIKRNIIMKLDIIFSAMEWDLKEITNEIKGVK